ncbi:MAG: hypothetical protein AVDCRST_MAG91-2006 [uncultured Sphingomonadaceae bacterium]|uniref:Phosphatidic acid phosphatase type 2/haloperoxidase domain-containing protein n=1 Tax=uncultured Sphingomonadaceae bacterium TaxID=169976 RepID=A0A6J4TA02_9SPHN|nr:MAG: hypothetical protein AVDCRST_MAG91-2006 [uncultured Sphingomonadaceae bacterium]
MQAIDNALLREMIGWGEALPPLWTFARGLTELGGSRWLVPLTLAVAAWLTSRGHRRHAAALLLVTFGGRAVVEIMKWALARTRPDFIDHPVVVHSLSFPSGHAGNSMIAYLALALIAGPLLTRGRLPAAAAVLLAVAIGLTRPILGVHWPTDVLAGWTLGVAWTLSAVWALSGWMEGRPVSRPPRAS